MASSYIYITLTDKLKTAFLNLLLSPESWHLMLLFTEQEIQAIYKSAINGELPAEY